MQLCFTLYPKLCSNSIPAVFLTLKQQLSLLPLMEPLIGVNFAHFAPYGSGQLNGENLLSGTFGSATLDGVSDYYSQLTYKVESALFSKLKQGPQSLFICDMMH